MDLTARANGALDGRYCIDRIVAQHHRDELPLGPFGGGTLADDELVERIGGVLDTRTAEAS